MMYKARDIIDIDFSLLPNLIYEFYDGILQ
jgi:hypothetical protein